MFDDLLSDLIYWILPINISLKKEGLALLFCHIGLTSCKVYLGYIMIYIGTLIILVILFFAIEKLIHNTPFKKDLHGDPENIVHDIIDEEMDDNLKNKY